MHFKEIIKNNEGQEQAVFVPDEGNFFEPGHSVAERAITGVTTQAPISAVCEVLLVPVNSSLAERLTDARSNGAEKQLGVIVKKEIVDTLYEQEGVQVHSLHTTGELRLNPTDIGPSIGIDPDINNFTPSVIYERPKRTSKE